MFMQPKVAQTQYGFSLDDVNSKSYLNEHIIDSQQVVDYWGVRGKMYHENYLCFAPCLIELKCVSTVACSSQTQLAPCVPCL